MKPTISIALITLGLTFPAPAMAAPIHLRCPSPSTHYEFTVNEDAGTVTGYAVGAPNDTPWEARQTTITASRINFLGHLDFPFEINRQTGVLSIDTRPYGEVINDYRCKLSPAGSKRLF